jgi:hypothetical protein
MFFWFFELLFNLNFFLIFPVEVFHVDLFPVDLQGLSSKRIYYKHTHNKRNFTNGHMFFIDAI